MDERPTFREKFDEFVRNRGYTSIQGISNEQTRSKLMTRFYLEEVVRKLEPDLVPDDPDEIEEGIIDGTGDGGVDFICRQEAKVCLPTTSGSNSRCRWVSTRLRAANSSRKRKWTPALSGCSEVETDFVLRFGGLHLQSMIWSP
jgi:hypothetical protein